MNTRITSCSLRGARAPIGGLLLHRSPSAIAGLVSPVVVDALKRQPRRAISHVCVEVLERLPSFANKNATHPIILGLRVHVPDLTPLSHRLPFIPRLRRGLAMFDRSVGSISAQRRKAMATARDISLRKKILLPLCNFCATVATKRNHINLRLPICAGDSARNTDKSQHVDLSAERDGFCLAFAHDQIYLVTGMDERNIS